MIGVLQQFAVNLPMRILQLFRTCLSVEGWDKGIAAALKNGSDHPRKIHIENKNMVKSRSRSVVTAVVEAAHNRARARATARAETLFNQLIQITAHARRINNTADETCVDYLEVVFNDQQGIIELIDHQPSESTWWVAKMNENRFKYILCNIVYMYYELRQPVQFDFILYCCSSPSYPMYISNLDLYVGGEEEGAAVCEPLHVDIIPAIRELLTSDDHNNGRRTIRVDDQGDTVVCTVQWNPIA